MKLIAIGDIHGRNTWIDIIRQEYDQIVFVGDYFDSRHVSGRDQIDNFKKILALKEMAPHRVVLLCGNHDFHYLHDKASNRYAGYQAEHAHDIKEVLTLALNKNWLQMCYLHGQYNHSNKYLFSHAGVTNTWLKNTGIANDHNLEENINQLFKHKLEPFTFTPGKNNCKEGNDVTQPPTWVRAQSLAADGLEGYTHVVGHTTCQAISGYKNNKLAIKFIDVLRNIPQYATIIDHKFGTETLIKDLVI